MAPYALVIAEDNPKDFEFLRQMVEAWEQDCDDGACRQWCWLL